MAGGSSSSECQRVEERLKIAHLRASQMKDRLAIARLDNLSEQGKKAFADLAKAAIQADNEQ